ncbi:MAG: sensor histidine kinase [Ignavibacteriales bacterium]
MKNLLPSYFTLNFYNIEDLRARLGWHINLRWIAILGVLSSIPVSQELYFYKISYSSIVYITSIMLLLNLLFFFLYRYLPLINEVFEFIYAEIQIITDLVILSFLIHYSGGIDNPFYFLYLVPSILSGIIFPGRLVPFCNAIVSAGLLTAWAVAEYFGFIENYKLEAAPISFSRLIISIIAFYLVNFVGVYIINNFMQRYRSLKAIIDQKNIQLEKSIEDRNKAYRFAAHEMKAPLTAIKSTLDVAIDLYGNTLNSEIKEMLSRAEIRSAQVLNMIKELIIITQYNLGVEEIRREYIEFVSWLKENVELQRPYARLKSINLQFVNISKHREVEIDKSGMERVINNLLNNALRYTLSGGSVTVEPFLKIDSFGFSVTDTGIGIEEDEMAKIFNEFYRSKQARQIEKFGTGLGLNIVNEIVKQNGGTVRVHSIPGVGSTFTVSIPYQQEESVTESEEEIRKLFLFE